MTTPTSTASFAEGDSVFITTGSPATEPGQRILFRSTVDHILETEEGDLLIVDGLRFRQTDGIYQAQSGKRILFLHSMSAELITELKDHGAALRKAKQATAAEEAARLNRISQASDAVRRARSELSSTTDSLRWRQTDVHRARAQAAMAQSKLDAYDSDVEKAKAALARAEAKLAAAESEAK